MSSQISPHVDYDAIADVLYIALAQIPAARGVRDKFGIIWRYDSVGNPVGATVVDFADLWANAREDLALKLQAKLGVSRSQALEVLRKGFKLQAAG